MKAKIRFVAVSDGNRGVNFIRDGAETKDIKDPLNNILRVTQDEDRVSAMRNELNYILEAFGFGF